jgi:predicted RNA-binding protein YlxR (DUF448 family)
LVRIVRTVDGRVSIDPTGKRSGRGAYLCHATECWRSALNRSTLIRALKIEVIAEEDLHDLNEFANGLDATASARE